MLWLIKMLVWVVVIPNMSVSLFLNKINCDITNKNIILLVII